MFSSYVYRYSPPWAQEAMLSARAACRKALREERRYEALLDQAEERQYWTARQLLDWRMEQAGAVLRAARRHVPFYRERDACHGERYDLTGLPFLTKGDVRDAGAKLLSDSPATRWRIKSRTSGTTGSPLVLYQSMAAIRSENAFVMRQLHWAGYTEGARRVWLRGDMIVPAAVNRPPFWRMSGADNMLMMSSYHLSEQSVPDYLDALRRFDPVIIQAYPSSVSFLANWLWNKGASITLPSLRGIITSSETLAAMQREKIEASFCAPVFDWYGSAERVAAIGTCELGNYHVIDDYGDVELVPVAGHTHEIVGTSLNNDTMPLVRYRTGDTVELLPGEERCDCGRSFRRVAAINGRDDDAIRTPDGRVIGRLDHIYKDATGIIEAQIVQRSLDCIEIRVVPVPGGYGEETASRLAANLRARVGMDIDIRVEAVESLPRSKAGKLRAVISSC